jgi:capping protein beta
MGIEYENAEIDSNDPNHAFLRTEFNREGNSYRNPFTNHYSPENSEGYRPSGIFRTLEENGNILFAEYVKQYYGGDTTGSFFVTENEEGKGNFSCGFFAKKSTF